MIDLLDLMSEKFEISIDVLDAPAYVYHLSFDTQKDDFSADMSLTAEQLVNLRDNAGRLYNLLIGKNS